jgi:predicted dehydrogenase
MLRAERPDVVSLCTPDDTHARWLLECAAQGVRGVWCEKPLAVGRAELGRLARQQRGLPAVQLNHWRRFIPELGHLRERLRRGEFGAVHGISGCYPEGWFRNGSHLVDLAFFLCGPLRVLWARAQGTGPDPRLTVAALGKGGAPVLFDSVPRRDYNLFELELRCERARVRVAENGRRVEIQRDRRDPAFRNLRLLRAQPDVTLCRWRDAFRNALGNLISCVSGRRGTTLSPVTDALAVGKFLVTAAGRARAARPVAGRERPR